MGSRTRKTVVFYGFQVWYDEKMNWKDWLLITATVVGLILGNATIMHFMVSPKFGTLEKRMDSMEKRMDSMETNLTAAIETLSNDIKADRRATSQRIDNLYLHAKKTGK